METPLPPYCLPGTVSTPDPSAPVWRPTGREPQAMAPTLFDSLLTAALAGRFEVKREIGRGGMATVYLARDVRHDRPVALKVMSPELGQGVIPDRFLAEIRTAANLQHPHIVPLYDSGEAGGLLFYTMPYVEGGVTLAHRLEKEGALSIVES